MSADGLKIALRDGILILTLANPPVNELTPGIRAALLTAIARQGAGCRGIVLAAEGAHFSDHLPIDPDPGPPRPLGPVPGGCRKSRTRCRRVAGAGDRAWRGPGSCCTGAAGRPGPAHRFCRYDAGPWSARRHVAAAGRSGRREGRARAAFVRQDDCSTQGTGIRTYRRPYRGRSGRSGSPACRSFGDWWLAEPFEGGRHGLANGGG